MRIISPGTKTLRSSRCRSRPLSKSQTSGIDSARENLELVGDVSGKKVLCYSCGDSNITVFLALKGAEVWALDVSVAAIERRRVMARRNGVENSITAVLGAGEDLPLPSQSMRISQSSSRPLTAASKTSTSFRDSRSCV